MAIDATILLLSNILPIFDMYITCLGLFGNTPSPHIFRAGLDTKDKKQRQTSRVREKNNFLSRDVFYLWVLGCMTYIQYKDALVRVIQKK